MIVPSTKAGILECQSLCRGSLAKQDGIPFVLQGLAKPILSCKMSTTTSDVTALKKMEKNVVLLKQQKKDI